jgi:hypothetical protein
MCNDRWNQGKVGELIHVEGASKLKRLSRMFTVKLDNGETVRVPFVRRLEDQTVWRKAS